MRALAWAGTPRHLGALAWLAASAPLHPARAAGWLGDAAVAPIEQRVAIAVAPSRTTVWTSLLLDGAAGPMAIIVPVPIGSAIDLSSDAWMEALEVATAPRLFPPENTSGACPGLAAEAYPFEIAGTINHIATVQPAEVIVLAGVGELKAWADGHALAIETPLASALEAAGPASFVAARFAAPGGPALTPTLRIAMPDAVPTLPLALTHAGSANLVVTTWMLGPGRGSLVPTTPVVVAPTDIVWNAKAQSTGYVDERAQALTAAGPSGIVTECSSHDALVENVSIAQGTVSIDGVITTFFERAIAYADLPIDSASCVVQAAAALSSSTPIAPSCPRAEYGVVGTTDVCSEPPSGGATSPSALRCGEQADDLAVALSGLSPSTVWLTRQTLRIGANDWGTTLSVEFGQGTELTPILKASSIDLGDCASSDAGTGPGFDSDPGGSGNPQGPVQPGGTVVAGTGADVYLGGDVGCDCSGTSNTVTPSESESVPSSDDDGTSSTGDDCDSDTVTESSGDDCGGDTTGDASGGEDCSNDSGTSGDDCSAESGGDDCSNDGGSADSCDGGGADGCDGGDCSIVRRGAADEAARARRRRAPRLSAMTLGALMVLAPLRRLRRRRHPAR